MRSFLFYFFILTAFSFPSTLFAQDKLGYVNVKKVINSVPEDLKSKSQVELQYQLNKVVTSIGEKDGYDMIIYGDLAYPSTRIDLTDVVIERMKGNQHARLEQNNNSPYKLGNFDYIKLVKALKGKDDDVEVESSYIELGEQIKSAIKEITTEGKYDLITGDFFEYKDDKLNTSGNAYQYKNSDITELIYKKIKHESTEVNSVVDDKPHRYRFVNIAKVIRDVAGKEQSASDLNQKFNRIKSQFDSAVSEIAKKENYELVKYLQVAYATKKIDITDAVVSKIKSENN